MLDIFQTRTDDFSGIRGPHKNLSKSYFLVNELEIFKNVKKYMALYGKFQKVNKAYSFIYEKSLFLDVRIF